MKRRSETAPFRGSDKKGPVQPQRNKGLPPPLPQSFPIQGQVLLHYLGNRIERHNEVQGDIGQKMRSDASEYIREYLGGRDHGMRFAHGFRDANSKMVDFAREALNILFRVDNGLCSLDEYMALTQGTRYVGRLWRGALEDPLVGPILNRNDEGFSRRFVRQMANLENIEWKRHQFAEWIVGTLKLMAEPLRVYSVYAAQTGLTKVLTRYFESSNSANPLVVSGLDSLYKYLVQARAWSCDTRNGDDDVTMSEDDDGAMSGEDKGDMSEDDDRDMSEDDDRAMSE